MLQTRSISWLWPAVCLLSCVDATRHAAHNQVDLWKGDDLAYYVTRPDLRPPLWNITKHVPEEIAPGYWFVSPYADFNGPPDRTEYAPCQAGPLIYDGDGNLVWAGACLDHNRNTFDFRPFQANGSTHLSYILGRAPEWDVYGSRGMGVVMNGSYAETLRLRAPSEAQEFNLHEFHLIEDGTKILMLSSHLEGRNIYKQAIPPHSVEDTKGHFVHDSIVEMNTATETVDYQWWPWFNGVSYNESFDEHPPEPNGDGYWDFFHANSIDKTNNGDYVVSARHANTIYKVHRANNTIAWRLGGKMSDFQQDFNFSSQHDTRVVYENATTLVLTFLDNASDDAGRQPDSARMSSAKMVALDFTPGKNRTATLLKQWDRPDARLTRKRGNVQMMDNANAFVCWSEQGFMSEHKQNGTIVMEAKFASPRFDTYRAYKAPFVGTPTEPPVLKSFVFQSDKEETEHKMVVSYISWNGATEVKKWKFYGSTSQTKVDSEAIYKQIGEAEKRGFETMFTSYGALTRIMAEGFDKDGHSLGKTAVAIPVLADSLKATDSHVNIALSIPEIGDGTPNTVPGASSALTLGNTLARLRADKGLWLSVGIAAVIVTLFAQATFLAVYALWRRRQHTRARATFDDYARRSISKEEYSDGEDSTESQPMMGNGKKGFARGGGVYGSKTQLMVGSTESLAADSFMDDGVAAAPSRLDTGGAAAVAAAAWERSSGSRESSASPSSPRTRKVVN